MRAYGAQAQDAVTVLVSILRASNAEEQRGAVMLFHSISEPALSALCKTLEDPDPELRGAAALAIPLFRTGLGL